MDESESIESEAQDQDDESDSAQDEDQDITEKICGQIDKTFAEDDAELIQDDAQNFQQIDWNLCCLCQYTTAPVPINKNLQNLLMMV